MSASIKSHRLLLMQIRFEHDVVLCRQRGRQLAAALGFSPQAQIQIATALSEIARNAFRYAKGGTAEFHVETAPRFATPAVPQQSLVVVIQDSGPGIANLPEILSGNYRSTTGLGLGIVGARRLMNQVDIQTSPAGTIVTLRQSLPVGITVRDPQRVQGLVDELLRQAPAGLLEEMHLQNQELLRAMEESRQREEEIQRINQELAETNSGVLALYDELETLHRVSVLMASQLELKPLIQSMTEVTTSLTNADLGAFYFRVEGGDSWATFATSGPDQAVLQDSERIVENFGVNFAAGELTRTTDVREESADTSAARFAQALADRYEVRSCLVVPIESHGDEVSGAMVFASRAPGQFSERSERIVASIAAQAVIGIQKSRLYHAVKASNEAKDQFLAMLSHELRTPLNPVLAIVSSWRRDPRIPTELMDEVAVVARNIRLEARLIDDLLDFNKLANGKLQIEHAPVDLHDVVQTTLDICRDDLEANKQLLELRLTATKHTITGDVARLQQVLWNVLKNAIKFSQHEGRITVSSSNPTPETIRLVVSDNGRGIEAGAIDRIFGAFEQGQPQVLARFGGLGLGLAIARTFVERHGGTIAASSGGLGAGAEFTIDFPLAVAEPENVSQTPAPSPPTAAQANSRILLIEDHRDTLATMKRLLDRKGYVVTTAPSGEDARREFATGTFDIIVSDLGLPDCSGFELIAEFRAIHPTPAIALSGYGMEADVESSYAAGFAAHLTKPIDFELLIGTLDRLLAEPPATLP